jgi:hypothetical protein
MRTMMLLTDDLGSANEIEEALACLVISFVKQSEARA